MTHPSPPPSQERPGILCPKCLLANPPEAAFCADCGAPIGMLSTIDPFQQTQAEGFAYRSAIDGPPRLIILVGMWLLFAPWTVAGPWILLDGVPTDLLPQIFYSLLAVGSAVILYRTTRNYVLKSRNPERQNTSPA